MSAGDETDLSGWAKRDERRRRAAADLVERVGATLPRWTDIFRERGVREAWLFGSTVTGRLRPGSDVDLAVGGCPPASFYRLAAELERALGMTLDVVDLDLAPPALAAAIRSGRRVFPRADVAAP